MQISRISSSYTVAAQLPAGRAPDNRPAHAVSTRETLDQNVDPAVGADETVEIRDRSAQSMSTQNRGSDDSERQSINELKDRDREVRAHEAAHAAAAGPYLSGGPSFSYQRGPDGQQYAVSGEVQIDTSPIEGDPEATIRKMQVVKAAALAPANPSGTDRAVAAAAASQEAQARTELQQQDQASDTTSPAFAIDLPTHPGSLIDAYA